MEGTAYRVKASSSIRGAVIFLHGLGDSGEGWSMEFRQRLAKHRPDVEFIFPNAPNAPVSLNMGMRMPSWFDIKGLELSSPEDKEGIQKMAEEVRKLIEETKEEYSLNSDKIILGGFSQGGGLALYTGLTHAEKLGGIIALSTWLPMRDYVMKRLNEDNYCPVFFGHGTIDPVVPMHSGEKSADLIKSKGMDVQFKKYRGLQHSSCAEEFGDIKAFLDKA